MDELERAIARIACPQPSEALDHRIDALLTQVTPPPTRRRWRYGALLCGTAACAGMIGFVVGEQRARSDANSPTRSLPAITAVAPSPQTLAPPIANENALVADIPLSEDQLASFFVRSATSQGLWGDGVLQVETSTAP